MPVPAIERANAIDARLASTDNRSSTLMHLVSCATARREPLEAAPQTALLTDHAEGERWDGFWSRRSYVVALYAPRRRGGVVHVGGRRRARGAFRGSPSVLALQTRAPDARIASQCCRRAVAERPPHARRERAAFDAMIRMFAQCAGFGQQLELGRSERDDSSRRLVQPIEARVQPRISAGGVAGQREVAVQPRLDALGLAVHAEEQQLGRGLGQMKQREEKKRIRVCSAASTVAKIAASRIGPLLADRRDDLHRVLEARRTGAAQHVRPHFDDASQQRQVPARRVLGAREEQRFVGASTIGGTRSACSRAGRGRRATAFGTARRRVRRDRPGSAAVSTNARSAPASMWAARCASLFGGQPRRRRRGSLEIEPFAGGDRVRAGEGNDEIRQRLGRRWRLAVAQPRQHAHGVAKGGRAVLRRDNLDRPMAIQVLERIDRLYRGLCHEEKSMAGTARLPDTVSDIAQTDECRTGNSVRSTWKMR